MAHRSRGRPGGTAGGKLGGEEGLTAVFPMQEGCPMHLGLLLSL
jgi:hypothetical protein